MRKIAITGNLAAGKSTVCHFFQECGAYVVDADEIVQDLLSPTTTIGKKVVEFLGSQIVVGNNIDKKKISEIVFSNPHQLNQLEEILHPAVRQELQSRFAKIQNDPSYTFFVAELPLLFEAGMENDFDIIIAVVADKEIAQHRFKGTHFTERHARQLPSSVKLSKADFVITNNGDLNVLRTSAQAIIEQLQE